MIMLDNSGSMGWDIDGNQLSSSPSFLSNPTDIVVDSSGDVYVIGGYSNFENKLYKIKNKLNIIFTTIVLIILLFITYFTFDSSLRRYAYTKSIGVYKLYQTHIISGYIFYRNFSGASEQILQYIEFTQKFSKNIYRMGVPLFLLAHPPLN